MRTHVLSAALGVILVSPAVRAEEPVETARSKTPTPVTLQVLLTRWQGDTKVASLPYTLTATTKGRRAWVRHGLQVPLKYEGKETPGNVVYKSLGVSLDCTVDPPSAERFLVKCSIGLSSLYAPAGAGAKATTDVLPPLLNNLDVDTSFVLRDGQTAQYASSVDPSTGEVLKAEVTLTVAK